MGRNDGYNLAWLFIAGFAIAASQCSSAQSERDKLRSRVSGLESDIEAERKIHTEILPNGVNGQYMLIDGKKAYITIDGTGIEEYLGYQVSRGTLKSNIKAEKD